MRRHGVHPGVEFMDCVRTLLLHHRLGILVNTTGGAKLNGKVILAAVGAFALLGIGFSMLAGATVPANTSGTSGTQPGETAGFEVSEGGLEDSGLQSSHDFQGEEQGEF